MSAPEHSPEHLLLGAIFCTLSRKKRLRIMAMVGLSQGDNVLNFCRAAGSPERKALVDLTRRLHATAEEIQGGIARGRR